ncbi:endonuclease/exonuclease/phosphatase family protein [Mycetocola zhadangensis]|uniref:endonuclease/exonuclease/phosphatase family protein n=1 Tax=Mycetocola zhadangensis TaxID=1164595 RepID=UPI003A4DC6C0
MRLVTWNVLWRFDPDWRARQSAILRVLDELQPDIVGLQECWSTAEHSQADVIAEHRGMHAAFASPSFPPIPSPPEHPDQQGVLMGVGLVSRWPILDVHQHVLPVSHRQVAPVALEARVATAEGTLFDVIVAATEWKPDFADDHLAQAERLADILSDADPTVPRFLLTDLNCDASQAEFAPVAAVATDTWERGGGDPAAVTLSSAVSFAPREAVKEIDRRVDHILVRGSSIAVDRAFIIDSPVDGVYPSDHFPVIADVRLGSARAS